MFFQRETSKRNLKYKNHILKKIPIIFVYTHTTGLTNIRSCNFFFRTYVVNSYIVFAVKTYKMKYDIIL